MNKNFRTFSDILQEKEDKGKEDLKKRYTEFFNKLMGKYGISSPSELSGDEKKDFYNELDLGWDEGEGVSKEGESLLKQDRKVDKDSKKEKNESVLSQMTNEKYQNFEENLGSIFEKMLEAIKENYDSTNYYDIAIEYLQNLKNNKH